jgi:hypothetical protein
MIELKLLYVPDIRLEWLSHEMIDEGEVFLFKTRLLPSTRSRFAPGSLSIQMN